MKLEESFATWEIHSTNFEFKESYPAVKFCCKGGINIGFTIHKWETDDPKGKFLAVCDIENPSEIVFDVSDIEQGESITNVHVFKYHASKWRPVVFKKKWIYSSKTMENHVNRILK